MDLKLEKVGTTGGRGAIEDEWLLTADDVEIVRIYTHPEYSLDEAPVILEPLNYSLFSVGKSRKKEGGE